LNLKWLDGVSYPKSLVCIYPSLLFYSTLLFFSQILEISSLLLNLGAYKCIKTFTSEDSSTIDMNRNILATKKSGNLSNDSQVEKNYIGPCPKEV